MGGLSPAATGHMTCVMDVEADPSYPVLMKPSIPDVGMVTRLEGEQALVRMKGEGSCEKCGVAAAGLCAGGLMRVLTAKNSKRARVGDTVKIGLVRRVHFKGYLLAYMIPATALVLGTVGGSWLGTHVDFPALDVIGGFSSLTAASFFSFRRLRRLDSSSSIEIVDVLIDPWSPGSPVTDKNPLPDQYLSY